jgi:hypothetical protein
MPKAVSGALRELTSIGVGFRSPDYPIKRSLVGFAFRITGLPDHPILSTPPALFSAALKTNHFRQSTLA